MPHDPAAFAAEGRADHPESGVICGMTNAPHQICSSTLTSAILFKAQSGKLDLA